MNKITKLLSVFVLAGAIGTGVAGAVGCHKSDDHTHNWTYTQSTDGTKHSATCDGCDEKITDEAHTYGTDHKCVCGKTDPSVVADVSVSCDKSNLKVGETAQLTAEITPDTATEKGVVWTASPADCVSISADGVVTALKAGTVTITGTSKSNSAASDTATISITEESWYDKLAKHEGNIIKKDFETAETLTEFGGTYGTKGVYYYGVENAAPSKGGKFVVEGGIVKSQTGAVANPESKTENIALIADLGTVKDIIEGYVEVTPSLMGGDWAIFQLRDSGNNEVFSIHTKDKNGALDYRLGGKSGTVHDTTDSITMSASETSKVYFRIDTSTGTLKVVINQGEDKTVCDTITSITDVKGLALITSNGGLRDISIDNLAVATYETSATELKAAVDAYATAATSVELETELTLTGEGVTAAVTAAKTAIDGAADVTAAKAAYTAGKSAIDAAILVQAKADANAKLTAYRADESFTHEGSNKDQMEKAKADGAKAIGDATTPAAVATALVNAKAVCAEVLTDAEDNAAKVTITFYTADNTEIGKLENLLDGRDSLSKDDIKTAIATYLTEQDKKLAAVYTTNTSGTLSDEITYPYLVTAKEVDGHKVDTPDAKLYVEVAEWSIEKVDIAAIKTEYDKTENCGITKDSNGRFKIADIYGSSDTAISGLVKHESFEFKASGKTLDIGTADMKPDASGAAQTYTYLKASGNTNDVGTGYTFVAKQDVTLIITYNTCDSGTVGGKKGKLVYKIGEADDVTVDVQTSAADQVYTTQIELKEGEEVVIYSSASRLILFGIDAKY